MSKETKKEEKNDFDPARAAYMIAWRDQYIEKLEERLQGRAEESSLVKALLFYALFGMSESGEGEVREALIPKEELGALLGAWDCRAEDAGEAYRICFTRQSHKGEADAACQEG